MVLKSPENVVRLAGTLISGGATGASTLNLALDFPYGGTVLGVVSSARFIFGLSNTALTAEPSNSSVFDIVQNPENAALVGVLRSFDPDAIALVFPSTVSGGDIKVDAKNEGFPYRPTTKAVVLLFAPKEPSHPYIVFYNAVPMVKEAGEVRLSAGSDMQMGIAFRALPDSTNRLYQWGKSGDIVVT